MWRKNGKKVILYAASIVLLGSVLFAQSGSSVPPNYHANYQFIEGWDGIITIFTKIKAAKTTGSELNESLFAQLGGYFDQVFPHLPQEGEFRSVYEQCNITTSQLSQSYSYDAFDVFLNTCHNALIKSMSKMNSQFAMKAKIKTNPSSGNAPLSVSFDARGSVDPSDDTIPSANYFWYYKDTNGVDQMIGQGPVVNHVFTQEGTYKVHLTVRSVNQQDKGILDGEAVTTVSVSPQSARVRVFANGKQLYEENPTKIGTSEAQDGVLLDGRATQPTGGRTIEKHTRTIKQGSKNIYTRTDSGRPGFVSVQLPAEGTFTVSLTITDNQSNVMIKNYTLMVSDPLAIIKANPEQGNTSTLFTFDGNASYSLTSTVKLYTREIFDEKNKKIDTFQGKSISKKFKKPGSYTVVLRVQDEQNRTDVDTYQVYVESTEPQAQFTIKPMSDRKYPSKFMMDASISSDIDIIHADDKLRYEWRFVPEQNVQVEEVIDGGRQVIASFNEPGTYKAKLMVQDSYGKTSEVVKEIKVESSLRPEIIMLPKATQRGVPITMVARNQNPNQQFVSYEWDFGDGNTEKSIGSPKITHTYDKVGAYVVTLKVYGPENQENTIKNMVFIGEKGSPTPAFVVKNNQATAKQVSSCPQGPAYLMDRRKNFTIDASSSINTKGAINGIKTYIQPQGDDIFEKKAMTYHFQELGCQFIDITVEDTENKKRAISRVRFNVVNALPTITDISLSFPQYGGGTNYGFNILSFGKGNDGLAPQKPDDVFSPKIFDPLAVQVTAQGVSDPDGVVSYYQRYYYKKDNPQRLLEVKITPASVSSVSFTLPREGGEYEFGVTMIDNDGGKARSVDILGGGRGVYFPADTKNVNIPIVTLKQSQTIIEAGDEVQFDVSAKLIVDKKDFATNRVIKYDFDGDGSTDLVTKKSSVSHIYRKDGEFTPKVVVVYRGNRGSDYGESITVQKSVKPLMYISQNGSYILARDISIGSIIESKLCVDARQCANDEKLRFDLGKKSNTDYKTVAHRYVGTGTYVIDIQVKDDLGQKAGRKYPVIVKDQKSIPFFHLLSIPEAKLQDKGYSIAVGNQLQNAVSYLPQYSGTGECYMDIDLSKDTNGDGQSDNDDDIQCNTLATVPYDGTQASRAAKIYYKKDNQTIIRHVTIDFIDAKNTLDPDQQVIYNKLGAIVSTIPQESEKNIYLRRLLVKLQSAIDDKVARGGLILDIEKLLKSGEVSIADAEKNQLEKILLGMKDASLIAAGGGTAYDQAKAEILLLTHGETKDKIQEHFANIESEESKKPDQIKKELQEIVNTLRAAQSEGGVDGVDINIVLMPNICRIMGYYEISSEICQNIANQNNKDTFKPAIQKDKNESSGFASSVIKRILIVVGILLLVFGGLVGFFVIKAKRAQAGQAE